MRFSRRQALYIFKLVKVNSSEYGGKAATENKRKKLQCLQRKATFNLAAQNMLQQYQHFLLHV